MRSSSHVVSVLCASLALAACGGGEAAPTADPSATGGGGGAPTAPSAPTASAPATGALCAGESHTCVLQPSGHVICSGLNRDGQLGDGTAQDRLTFVPVVGLTNAIDLDCAYHHTCAVRADGHVVCWGRSAEGQLGAPGPVFAPVEVPTITDAVEVSTGRGFSCARRASGAVSCWGEGEDGQLGTGRASSTTPVAVAGLTDAAEIDSGYAHTCARRASGAVSCWGKNESGALGNGATTRADGPVEVAGIAGATHVGAAGNHSCAVTAAGLSCWGANGYAQLGNGHEEEQHVPTPFAVPGTTGITALALGDQRTCIATASAVSCWGYNNFVARLLGIDAGQTRNVLVPTAVPGITDVAALASGHDFSCAIRTGGALACFGAAGFGQTGEGSRDAHPARDVVPGVLALAPAASVRDTFAPTAGGTVSPRLAIGSSHVCTVVADGHVHCFGENGEGQLGNGSTLAASAAAAAVVDGISDAIAVVASQTSSCALRAGGTVACWGALAEHGTPGWPVSSSLPVAVAGITDAVEIALAGTTLCAIGHDASVHCIGEGSGGELGNGATADSTTPVAVAGLMDATHLAAIGSTFCAVRSAGSVTCWGRDATGECGNGPAPCGGTPVEVSGLAHATAIDGYGRNFCAVDGGRVLCWGSNDHGQLGNGSSGSTEKSDVPVAVGGVRGATSVGVGTGIVCATGSDGEAWCWGQNAFGTSGADTTGADVTAAGAVHRTADPAVAAFTPYASADCGTNFCCGLHRDGNVSCWGSTPLGGSGGLLGIANVRSPHPVAATGFSAPATP